MRDFLAVFLTIALLEWIAYQIGRRHGFAAGVERGRDIERMDIAPHRLSTETHFDDGPMRPVFADDPFDAIDKLIGLTRFAGANWE